MGPLFRKEDKEETWFISKDQREYLTDVFQAMLDPVVLEVYTRQGENDPYNDFILKFAGDLDRLSDKIELRTFRLDSEKARERGVERSPTILIQPETYRLRYTGAPAGEEGRSFIMTILMASQGVAGISEFSKELLGSLEEERHVQVFVNPSCPYCPGQVINGFKAAVANPALVSAECIETNENSDLAEAFQVGSVPHTVVNGMTISRGYEPEEMFMQELVSLTPAQEQTEHVHAAHGQPEPVMDLDVLVIGAGPAGLTAAIYAERAGLRTVVLEKSIIGGQVAVTPFVENYPAFRNIPGKELMAMIEGQARDYVDIREGEEVLEIKIGKRIEAITHRGRYTGKALILATGATWKKLDVPGEDRLFGRGVSYCSTCDGYLYRNKKVVVVGGGNTALTDALYLKNLGADVSIVHRRDRLRAEQRLQEAISKENIPVLWNMMVTEIVGDNKVRSIQLTNTGTGETEELEVDAVFLAIGELPNSGLARDLGIAVNDQGEIAVDRSGRTNIPRIYSAGDVTGGVNQIVTAVGEGASAALAAFEDISRQPAPVP